MIHTRISLTYKFGKTMSSPFRSSFLYLMGLAFKSRFHIPVLLTVCFLVFDIRLQVEVNINMTRHRANERLGIEANNIEEEDVSGAFSTETETDSEEGDENEDNDEDDNVYNFSVYDQDDDDVYQYYASYFDQDDEDVSALTESSSENSCECSTRQYSSS